MEAMNWNENAVRNCMRVRIRAKTLELLAPPSRQKSHMVRPLQEREFAKQGLFQALTILKKKSQSRHFQGLSPEWDRGDVRK